MNRAYGAYAFSRNADISPRLSLPPLSHGLSISLNDRFRDDIDDLAGKVEELDELLHGERSRSDSGLVGQVNKMETDLNSLLRVMYPDHTGRGGFLHEFNEVKRQVHGKEVNSEYRWKFWTAIIMALISSATLLFQSWPNIEATWNKKPTSPVGKMIYNAKHPRIKKYKVKIVPAPVSVPEPAAPPLEAQ